MITVILHPIRVASQLYTHCGLSCLLVRCQSLCVALCTCVRIHALRPIRVPSMHFQRRGRCGALRGATGATGRYGRYGRYGALRALRVLRALRGATGRSRRSGHYGALRGTTERYVRYGTLAALPMICGTPLRFTVFNVI